MRRVLSITVVFLLIFSTCCVNGFAFGGYAHWDIARRTASLHNLPVGRNQARAFMAGCLVADIGKPTWDDLYTVSDSKEFAAKMMSIQHATEQDAYFARGWQAHVYQDNNGSVGDIINDGDSYRVNCGQIDEYLRDTLDITCPINGTDSLYICYEPIRNTYQALHNFSPTGTEIMEEVEKMYLLYNAQIALNFSGMSTNQISAMNTQFNSLASNCYSVSSFYSVSKSRMNALETQDTMELILAERKNPQKQAIIQSVENQVSECAHFETISVDNNGGAVVRFVFDDEEAYFELVEQYVLLILS